MMCRQKKISDTPTQPQQTQITQPPGGMEWNVGRPASEDNNFDLSKDDPGLCQDACARDPKCKAWTYVKPNTTQGPRPRCWLKYDVPSPKSNTCCISGVKEGQGVGKTFNYPMIKGYRLDWCRQWGTDCGEGAAKSFCCSMGYSKAASWEMDPGIGGQSPTYVIETGQICNQGFCNGFKYIKCE